MLKRIYFILLMEFFSCKARTNSKALHDESEAVRDMPSWAWADVSYEEEMDGTKILRRGAVPLPENDPIVQRIAWWLDKFHKGISAEQPGDSDSMKRMREKIRSLPVPKPFILSKTKNLDALASSISTRRYNDEI